MASEPLSTCGACGQTDDHPKHQILVGYNNEHTNGIMFHEHDADRDGVIHYHFDCDSPWHNLHAVLGTHEDAAAHAERMAVADHHAQIVALCRSGVKGEQLRNRIVEGDL